jgi:acyl-CoA synthetase (AMP-forming)/AMP-acid ligase II
MAWVTAAHLLAERHSDLPLPGLGHRDDVALLQYTSGSTGDPKGVTLSHANLLANIRALGAALAVGPNDIGVSWLPLYHDMGLIGAWLGPLCWGIPIVVMSPLEFLTRPERWLWAIHRHRGTLSAAPNFAYELCVRKTHETRPRGFGLEFVARRVSMALNLCCPKHWIVLPNASRHTVFPPRIADAGLRPGGSLARRHVRAARPRPARGPHRPRDLGGKRPRRSCLIAYRWQRR